jgi:hypothetical protein
MTGGATFEANMEQGNKGRIGTREDSRKEKRATFAEVFGSIKFNRKASSSTDGHWPQPGFAVNRTLHAGIAASDDDYK